MSWLKNFIEQPKTTVAGLVGGTAAGAAALAALTLISTEAGCNFANVDWITVVNVVLASSAAGTVAGGVMKDAPKA